jgi:hypothetical protein
MATETSTSFGTIPATSETATWLMNGLTSVELRFTVHGFELESNLDTRPEWRRKVRLYFGTTQQLVRQRHG